MAISDPSVFHKGLRVLIGAATLVAAGHPLGQTTGERETSAAAFTRIAEVMRSPRCMNCHTTAEFPRQGDASRRHDQTVIRGAEGKGAPTLQCVACHREENSPDGYVPGAPNWQLAPLDMSWERLGDKALCERLLDKSKNGNRLAKGLVIHMVNDPLVQWAWTPGRGRVPPPIGQQAFRDLLQVWESNGAACPDGS